MSGVKGWRRRAQTWVEVGAQTWVEVGELIWGEVRARRPQDVARLGPRRAGRHSQEAMVVVGLRYFRMAHRA